MATKPRSIQAMSAAVKKKHYFCFICGRLDEKENEKIALFYVPKGKVDELQNVIVKSELNANSRICSQHFDFSDIDKGK